MLKERRIVAEQVAVALFEAEAAIDAALTKTASLAGAMPAVRRQAGASALIGQDALEHASQALMALAEARRAIVETHKELSIVQGQIGLGAITMGGDSRKPPLQAVHAERIRMRALRIAS
ncbi:hypothetical protein [Phenylobacterium sp.]|jgi:hypothetical protein|uniref:hypothetical protein n=1 Tax=Phenylobacterium sp. TaxID=1871053 RepID=UPI0037C8B5A0